MTSLSKSINDKDIEFILNFQSLDDTVRNKEIRSLSTEDRIKYLRILSTLVDKGEDVYDGIKELLSASSRIFLNEDFRKEVNKCCNIIKKYTINYNKLIFLRGKIDFLDFKKRCKKKKKPKRVQQG